VLRGLRLGGFEAHARRGFRLADFDQLPSFTFRERLRYFLAEIFNRTKVVNRFEKSIQVFAGENQYLIKGSLSESIY
jgi:hypothetical protein